MTRDPLIIAVDVGNSSLGIGCYGLESEAGPLAEPIWHNQFLHHQLESPDWWEGIASRLGDSPAAWLVASVQRPRSAWLAETVRLARPEDTFRLLDFQEIGIEVSLAEPQKVGIDRLAAAAAVNQLRPEGTPAIVIDAGSAVTIDLVDAAGCFCGGTIFPGHRMAASALARQTDLLPEARIPSSPAILGASTEQAIASGIYWGTLGAAREIVCRLRAQHGVDAGLFLTGGSMAWRDEFRGEVTCCPNLVLSGIALSAGRLLRQARRDNH